MVYVRKNFASSDHFPVVAEFSFEKHIQEQFAEQHPARLNWKKANERSISAYSRLCQKLCHTTLMKFYQQKLDGPQLYEEIVNNLKTAANACIPKYKKKERKGTHNIPMWRERMSSFKNNVDFWLQTQFTQGGPNHCTSFVRLQLRLARSQFRRQVRILRREIQNSIAEHVTVNNCHKTLFGKKLL